MHRRADAEPTDNAYHRPLRSPLIAKSSAASMRRNGMSLNRWDSRDLLEFIKSCENETYYPDEPKSPHWMDRQASLDRRLLFSRLRGFITYGSPLEILRTYGQASSRSMTRTYS
jgi:hypothetical protein